MGNTSGLPFWHQNGPFFISRVNFRQKSNELSVLHNQLSSFVVTSANLRDDLFVTSLFDVLDEIIQYTEEIMRFLSVSLFINRGHPANLKVEKTTNDVGRYAIETKRSLRRLSIRRISSRHNFQLENQIIISIANLNAALSVCSRVLQNAQYHELFFMRANR